jgi:sec-independent protein translocase protein TatC
MFGVSFQLPLAMLFLERISIFDAQDYRNKRRIAILVISILSMLLTPSPDPASMLLMMFPLLALYELGIYLCGSSPAKRPFGEPEAA